MGRQIPKNVRQIGNVSDNYKIYIEDYVDIFLNQLCEKTTETLCGAFLIGEVVEEEDNAYIYVSGAINMQKLVVKGKDIVIEETVWKKACETCKEFFGDAEILGWAVIGGEQSLEISHNIQKMHQKYFHREKSIFVTKNGRDKEEKFYINKFQEMFEAKGHYVFYERNAEMQEYMIFCRKNVGVTPSENVDDHAAKNFRNIIKEKMDRKEPTMRFRPAYLLSVCCLLVVFGVGAGILERRSQIAENEVAENEIEEVVQVGDLMEDQVEEIVIPENIEEDISGDIMEEVPEEIIELEPVVEPEDEMEDVSGLHMEEVYVVEKGDTLASISKKVYGDITRVSDICELNGLEDGNLIFIGQKLLLP